LVRLCESKPQDAIWHLMNGHFEPWLTALGRADLARAATFARQSTVEGRGLEQFLDATGLPHTYTYKPPSPPPPQPQRGWAWLAIAAIVLCVLGATVFGFQQIQQQQIAQATATAHAHTTATAIAHAHTTATAQAQAIETAVAARVAAGLTVSAPSHTVPPLPAITLTSVPTRPPESPQKRLDPVMGTTGIEGVVVVDLATSTSRLLYGEIGTVSAAWSPDGTKVLVSSIVTERDTLKRILRIVDASGQNIRNIHLELCRPAIQKCNFFGPYEAIWSPDGRRIFLREGNALAMRNADGSPAQGLASSPATEESYPLHIPRFWSVDDKWVIIISYTSPTYTLTALEINGRKRVPVDQLTGLQVYDQRYWPWRAITPPATCKSLDYFSCP